MPDDRRFGLRGELTRRNHTEHDRLEQGMTLELDAGMDAIGDILASGCALIDVRAEIEFEKGAIPGSVNLPILRTAEREQVGTCYKRRGQEAAIKLGHSLVTGDERAVRTERWCDYIRSNPGAQLFCWRGGLRSRLAGEWVRAEGVEVPVVPGGFKALRLRLLRELDDTAREQPMLIVGGSTGSGKTEIILSVSGGIDLEGYARHRGSSFGRRAVGPPTQMNFENQLALTLLKWRRNHDGASIVLEDESRQIGAVTIPEPLFRAMSDAPLVVVERPLEERVERILSEYCGLDLDEWLALEPDAGYQLYADNLLDALARIRKRLGGVLYAELNAIMRQALDQQRENGDISRHRDWIRSLLVDYYDPRYNYQLDNSARTVVFRGTAEEVIAYCQANLS